MRRNFESGREQNCKTFLLANNSKKYAQILPWLLPNNTIKYGKILPWLLPNNIIKYGKILPWLPPTNNTINYGNILVSNLMILHLPIFDKK